MNDKWFFRAFCLLLFFGGATIAIVLPSFQVPDEIAHYTRAFALSRGIFFPTDTLAMPPSYGTDAAIFHPWIERDDLVKTGHLAQAEREHFGLFAHEGPDVVAGAIQTEDIYPFPLYAPGGIALAVIRPLHPTITASLLFARLVTLCVCGLVLVAGLRLMPMGKELYALVALFPTNLQQLASVSPDAVVISLAFFVTALILRTAFRHGHRVITTRESIVFACLSVAIGFAKIDIVVLLLLLLVPQSRFASLAHRAAFVGGNWLIAVLVVAISPSFTTVTSHAYTAYHLSTHIDLITNARFVIDQPSATLHDWGQTLLVYGPHYVTEMVGTFGWLSFEMPFPFVMLGIIVSIVLAVRIVLPSRRAATHAVCAFAGVVAFAVVFVSLFVTNEAADDISRLMTGTALIEGVQGRYFLPFVLLPGVALALGSRRHAHVDRFLSLFAATLLLAGGVHTILASYY